MSDPSILKTLRARLASGSGGLLTRIELGRALLASGRISEALEVARATSALAPGVADAALLLGEALLACGHLPAAIAEMEQALRLDPAHHAARYALGCAWLEAGEGERAIAIFSEIPGSDAALAERAARKIAEATALRDLRRAAPGYVRHLFDQFSADYDNRMLGELSYRAHRILRDLADLMLGGSDQPLDILDLGCGTGLSGEAFHDLARRLDGIDLAPRMIEAARARGIYDSLAVADIETHLAGGGPGYDLILAADSFVYLGDLAPVLHAARRRLAANGFLFFTVEAEPGEGYSLGPKRRYRHSETYLRAEAGRAGFEVMGLVSCTPRLKAHAPVEGFAVALLNP